MVSPYRAGESPNCPRCKKPLPPTDIARCATTGCGIWVSAYAATVALTEIDRRPDPITRWERIREPCPLCGEKMALCGDDPGLLQGCSLHGYFIDADKIQYTGLARTLGTDGLDAALADPASIAAYQEQLEAAENARAAKAEKRVKKEEAARRAADAEKRVKKEEAARRAQIAAANQQAEREAKEAMMRRTAESDVHAVHMLPKTFDGAAIMLAPLVRYIERLEARLAAAEARLDAIERERTS